MTTSTPYDFDPSLMNGFPKESVHRDENKEHELYFSKIIIRFPENVYPHDTSSVCDVYPIIVSLFSVSYLRL